MPDPLSGDVFETFTNRPLFSDEGPSVFDINQGVLGDCCYPGRDRGDRLRRSGRHSEPTWSISAMGRTASTSAITSTGSTTDWSSIRPATRELAYVSLGEQGSVWATVMEKAFTHYRMQADSYHSIEGGFSFDVFVEAFQSQDAQQVWFNHDRLGPLTAAQHTAKIIEMMEGGYAPTLGSRFRQSVGIRLIRAHQYVVLDYNLNVFGLVEHHPSLQPVGHRRYGTIHHAATRTTGS